MKANLVKQLESALTQRKTQTDGNEVLMEANRLIESDGQRDVDLLTKIGAQSALAQSQNEKGKVLEIEKQEQFYSGSVFVIDQIIGLGAKYRLKFLPSQLFTGYIDPIVASEIRNVERSISKSMLREQAEKRNMTEAEYLTANGEIKFSFDDYSLKNKFYILAPAKAFKLQKGAMFSLKQPDPILFFDIDGTHFRLIKKWGSDFTIFRRLLGMATKNLGTSFFSFLWLPALLVILSLAFFVSPFFLFLFAAPIITSIIVLVNCDVDSDFFGEKHVTKSIRYWV